MKQIIVTAGVALVMLAGRSVAAPAADCDALRPKPLEAAASKRPVTTEDLARLRDIGPQGDLTGQASNLGLSPDGRTVAFILRQADPRNNRYCTGLFTVDIASGQADQLDDAGDVIFSTLDYWGVKDYPTGVPIPITPKWSPDGKTIAYLRRMVGQTSVRLLPVDGEAARTLEVVDGDVDGFAWIDGGSVVVSVRTERAKAGKALETEGLQGFRYDARFMPMAGLKPFRDAVAEHAYWTFPRDRIARPATAAEVRRLADGEADASAPGGRPLVRLSRAPFPALHTELAIRARDGQETRCQAPECTGRVIDAWLSGDESGVVYLSREGWADEMTALYLWAPGKAPRRVWATKDLVTDCHLVRHDLLCLAESSLLPRRMVAIPLSGRGVRTVFDPNPDYASRPHAPAERLHWRNALGLPVIGDLVRPANVPNGGKVPLVVVQYVTRGFLRGGTGDEYPIQALATAGFAVLSFQRPADVSELDEDKTPEAATRAAFKDWADRRSVHSALMRGIDLAVARGGIDPERVGITGLSDGASTVQYALVNSDRFAAAALSTCCQDPKTQMLATGPATASAFQRMGFPKSTDAAQMFWAPYSIAMNASRIRTPVLMQLAEDEYLTALESYTALQETGVPVEMYVFPDERHIKWQPAHRLAVYDRNLRWFQRWLMTE